MESRFLRIAYVLQFVVSLMVTFEVWAQVGGQGHLDLMPWYWKLLLAAALSLTTVKATAAAVNIDRFWNKWTFAWLVLALALIVAMGVLTYYEHLHEPDDEGDEPPAQIHLSRSSLRKQSRLNYSCAGLYAFDPEVAGESSTL